MRKMSRFFITFVTFRFLTFGSCGRCRSTKIWPLGAISHQMTVRDLSQLPPSKLQPLGRQIDNQQP